MLGSMAPEAGINPAAGDSILSMSWQHFLGA